MDIIKARGISTADSVADSRCIRNWRLAVGNFRARAIRAAPAPLLHRRRFRRDFREEHPGASQRFRHVGTDVLRAHVLLEFRLPHQLRGLLTRTAENQSATAGSYAVREFFQRTNTG